MDVDSSVLDRNNREIYSSPQLAQQYARQEELQPAEAKILELFCPRLSTMRMLDIGVGGGRTTHHFAPYVSEYIGIDYSDAMVAACKSKFSGRGWVFQNADVRDLRQFPDKYFDFVLFSYNGIDYISDVDRSQSLREIRRVLKNDGIFAFSTHNFYSLRTRVQSVPFSRLKLFLASLKWKLFYFWNNKNNLPSRDADYAFVRDGALGFRLATYYARPDLLVSRLSEMGLEVLKLFQMDEAQETSVEQLVQHPKDWFYIVCQKVSTSSVRLNFDEF